jgi:VanZ family protein
MGYSTGPDRPGLTMFNQSSFGISPCGGEQVEIKWVVAYLPAMTQRVSSIAGWLALAFIVYATLSPIDGRPVLAGPQLEHFAAFALVGLAFALAYPSRMSLVVVIVVGAAVGLEALQVLTPDRHARVVDAAVKGLGGLCGISAGQLMSLLLRLKPARSAGPIDLDS